VVNDHVLAHYSMEDDGRVEADYAEAVERQEVGVAGIDPT